jgi:hypothetical protein
MNKIFAALCLLFLLEITYVASYGADTGTATATFVSQIPYPARAGDVVELRFKIENYGSTDLTDLTYQLATSYPFLAIPGEEYTQTIPTLSAYQNQDNALIIKYRVQIASDAKEGSPEIDLKQVFSQGNAAVQSFPIVLSSSAFAHIIVDKAQLDPGQETPLKFTITNSGNSPIDNIVFSWSETNNVILPIYSDNTKYIKHLNAGQSTDLDYTVIADTNAARGLYQLTLTLKFDTTNGTQTLQTKTGMFVGGETDFDVTFSQSSAGQTSISIANIGNNPAYSVTVSIPTQTGYRVSGSQSSIIGNLDKGDYTIASFQLTSALAGNVTGSNQARGSRNFTGAGNFPGAAANISSPNVLKVQLDYTDSAGQRHTIVKNVPIDLRSSTTTTSTTSQFGRQSTSFWTSPIAIAGGIILLVIVIGGFVIIRRRNAKNKQLVKKR